jgi:hypothetical protein
MFYYQLEMEHLLPALPEEGPEEDEYRDQGCDLFPSCLNCPLRRCRYDEKGGRTVTNEPRDEKLLRLKAEGKNVNQLAGLFGISKRTVHRILRRARGG